MTPGGWSSQQVGAHAERYQPARVAAIAVPLALLAAVFAEHWLIGVLLVCVYRLAPLNLSTVGMGTAALARRLSGGSPSPVRLFR